MENKKIENPIPELEDEALDQAAGGGYYNPNFDEYDCKGGCGGHYYGRVPYYVGNQPYCLNCYAEYMKNRQPGADRDRLKD